MTTAPTPSDAERLARGLEEGFCGHAAWLQPAAAELRRQQAEVESLRAERDEADRRAGAAERSAAAFHEDHQRFEQVRRRMKEQWGVDDRVSFDVVWQQALDAKQALAKLEARKPLPLSDEQIDAIADGMPGGLGGFMKTWGWRQFARKILELRAPPTWEPQFDCMAPGQEELAIQFCAEIAGPRGKPGRNPDPVRLLEMAQALYKAEADAHGITGGSS